MVHCQWGLDAGGLGQERRLGEMRSQKCGLFCCYGLTSGHANNLWVLKPFKFNAQNSVLSFMNPQCIMLSKFKQLCLI